MSRKQCRKAAAIALLAIAAIAYPAQAATKSCANGYVALTFDDGPNAATTARLLAALRESRVRATFFTVGANIEANPRLQRQTQAEGHWIANHTFTHPDLTGLDRRAVFTELVRTQLATVRVNRAWPTLFRPPYGATNAGIAATARSLGMAEVLWTVDSRDWAGVPADEIADRARALEPGGIILMHDGIENTIAAVPRIVAELSERGLCAGRIAVRGGRTTAVAP
jgi:peptidoglycan/xylan/chitin deacetylase (PgdA/CDA1 family)